VLDLMLPGEDGCRSVPAPARRKEHRSIIMRSAKGEDVDRIVGLEMGRGRLPAQKPFNPRELVARINAVLRRRAAPLPPGAPAVEPERVSFGNMTVKPRHAHARPRGPVDLAHHGPSSPCSKSRSRNRETSARDKLMELARGREYEVFDRSIDAPGFPAAQARREKIRAPAYIRTCGASATCSARTARRSELRLWPRSLPWRTFLLLAVWWWRHGRLVPDLSRVRGRASAEISQNLVSIVNLTARPRQTPNRSLRRELLSDLASAKGIQV